MYPSKKPTQNPTKNNDNKEDFGYTIKSIRIPKQYHLLRKPLTQLLPNDDILIDSNFLYNSKKNDITELPTDDVIAVFDAYIITKTDHYQNILNKNGEELNEHTQALLCAKINLFSIINLGKNHFLSFKQEKDHFTLSLNDIDKKEFNKTVSSQIKTENFHYLVKQMKKLPSGLIACLCERSNWVRGANDNRVLHLFEIISTKDNSIYLQHLGYVFPHIVDLSTPNSGRGISEIRYEGEYSLIWEEQVFNLNSLFKSKNGYSSLTGSIKTFSDMEHFLCHRQKGDIFSICNIKKDTITSVKIPDHKVHTFELLSDDKVVVVSKNESDQQYYIFCLDFKFNQKIRNDSYQIITNNLPIIPKEIAKLISEYGMCQLSKNIPPNIPAQSTNRENIVKKSVKSAIALGVNSLFKPAKSVTPDDVELAVRKAPSTIGDMAALAVAIPFFAVLGMRGGC